MTEKKEVKTKSELMDSFVQIAIAKGYSDYDGEAARFINETVDMYSNLPQSQLTIPKDIADEIDCVVNPIGQIVLKSGILSDFTVEAISWIYKNNKNGYIAIAYANPLTRDLVKVVADE